MRVRTAAERAAERKRKIAADPIGMMARELHTRWARIFAWTAMGMREWDDQNLAQFSVAYRTYKDFCERHGRPVLSYGLVDFETGTHFRGTIR